MQGSRAVHGAEDVTSQLHAVFSVVSGVVLFGAAVGVVPFPVVPRRPAFAVLSAVTAVFGAVLLAGK